MAKAAPTKPPKGADTGPCQEGMTVKRKTKKNPLESEGKIFGNKTSGAKKRFKVT